MKHIDRKYGGSSFKRARENIAMEITGYGTEHTDFSAKCFAVASLQEWNSPMKWLSVCYRKKNERGREKKLQFTTVLNAFPSRKGMECG